MSAPSPDRSGVRVFPPAIYIVGLLLGFVIQWLWPARIAPVGLLFLARVAGTALLLAGLVLSVWALATFRKVGTTPNPTRPTTAFAFGGPYRFTRNPMYLGLVVMCIGVALEANALWPLLSVPFIVIIVRRAVIDPEERYLEAKFGREYLAFKGRVRRWL